MLAALAFLYPNQVTHAYEELNEDLEPLELDEEIKTYDCFEDTYIGRRQRRGRRRPITPLPLSPDFEMFGKEQKVVYQGRILS